MTRHSKIVREVIQEETGILREEINKAIVPIKTALNKCNKALKDHEEQLKTLDARLNTMEKRYEQLSSDHKALQAKIDDLENRGRRCNLRIIGVPENLEEGNPTQFVAKLLFDTLGGPDSLTEHPVLDRAHRLAERRESRGSPQGTDRPRPFIIWLHYFQEKERILHLSRQKGRLEFQGKRIMIFLDYSVELSKQRAAYNEVKALLGNKERVQWYGIVCPYRFRINFNSKVETFNTPQEAKDFILANISPPAPAEKR